MADIELVIKIDEELYNYRQTEKYDEHLDKRFDYQIRFAVKKGTPLPKGHGRLIDEDKIIGKIHGVRSLTAVLDAPTIIEADKGERR